MKLFAGRRGAEMVTCHRGRPIHLLQIQCEDCAADFLPFPPHFTCERGACVTFLSLEYALNTLKVIRQQLQVE